MSAMRSWLCTVALVALVAGGVAAQETPLGYVMLYNAGPTLREGVALGSTAELGFALPAAGVVVRDGAKELPAQVTGDTLAVGVALAGWEHKRVAVYAGKSAAAPAVPLRHAEDQGAWMTLGPQNTYEVRIGKPQHGVTAMRLGGEVFDAGPGWDVWVFPPTKDDRKDGWTLEPPKTAKDAPDFTCEALATGPLFTRYRLKWSCEQARVEQVLTVCSGEAYVQFDNRVEVVQPLSQVLFGYHLPYRFDTAKTIFWPLGQRVVGRWEGYKSLHWGQYDPAPGWVFGWSPMQGGLGFAVTDRGVFTRLAYAVQDPDDVGYFRWRGSKGKTGPDFYLTAQSEDLLAAPVGTLLSGTVYSYIAKEETAGPGMVARIKSPLRLRRALPVDMEGVVGLPGTPLTRGTGTKVEVGLRNNGTAAAVAAVGVTPLRQAQMAFAAPPGGQIPPGGLGKVTVTLTPTAAGPQEILLGLGGAPSRLRVEAEPVVTVEKVWPNKVLYANNEAARCEVTLQNWQATPQTVELVTTLRGDLDGQEALDKRTVALKPQERQVVTVNWNTGSREYGWEIACAAQQGGKTISSGSEYCGIATDWLKIMQDGSDRYYYHNAVRIHNTQMPDGSFDVPEGDFDLWWNKDYYSNGTDLRTMVAGMKENGIKPTVYLYAAATPWAAADFDRDPSRVLYYGDGHAADEWGVNLYAQGFRDWLVGDMLKAIEHVGYEAVFFDVSQAPPQAARERFDWQGKPAGQELGQDPDAIGAAWFKDVRERIRAKYPHWTNMHNPEVFKNEFQFPLSFAAAGGMAMVEIGGGGASITDKSSKYGQWLPLLETFDSIRATKHRYGVEAVRSYPLTMAAMGGDTCLRTMNAVTFACGWNSANVCYPPGSIQSDWMRRYLQFATRYSALLYHDKTKWIPPEAVTAQVGAPANVRWKQYCWQRDLGKELDLMVHLVQMPPDPYVYRRPAKQPKLANLAVSLPLPAGATLRDVWLLSPDRETRAEKLTAKTAGGRVMITVPDLEVWDLVLVRCAKKG